LSCHVGGIAKLYMRLCADFVIVKLSSILYIGQSYDLELHC
jgi:hypothetical protein